MENQEQESMTLFEKLVKGITDAIKVPLKRNAMSLKLKSAHNDLRCQKVELEQKRFKELEKLEGMSVDDFLQSCRDIRTVNEDIEDVEAAYKELFNEDISERH